MALKLVVDGHPVLAPSQGKRKPFMDGVVGNHAIGFVFQPQAIDEMSTPFTPGKVKILTKKKVYFFRFTFATFPPSSKLLIESHKKGPWNGEREMNASEMAKM